MDALRGLAKAYEIRAIDDAPFTPLTLPQLIEEEDEEDLDIRFKELSYELPAASWKPVTCVGQPLAAPRRFIDGTVVSRTVAALTVKNRRRPALLACVGALELDLEHGSLVRRTSPRVETVLCLLSNDMPEEHLGQLAAGLRGLGIDLITSITEELSPDLELLRRRTFDLASHRMEEAERAILLARPAVAALVDGLLERRLVTIESQSMSALGMVKRQVRQYLPNAFVNFLYELAPGERSPAFLLQTKHATIVSWYLRLTAEERAAPSYGLVRLTMSQQYLEKAFADPAARYREISALSAWALGLRHREGHYARAGISLEPIVRVEDELRALLPRVGQQVATFHRALGV
ncbi:MAG: hypothetical protein M3T56_13565 [Chloroflexota bacterium]|nr:hypothetical protein [Chloroflexota bacterium]